MIKFITNKITKNDFLKLNENDLMFITNPGRMGDEDGTTFIIKHNKEFTIYRVDGWMYRKRGEQEEISLNDALKQFPKWCKTWKKSDREDETKKYKYLYMGFGNGLSIDKSIYKEFEPYLNDLIEKHLNKINKDERESLKYATIFNVWEIAFINMIKDKDYILIQK